MSKNNKKIEVKTVSMIAIKNKITELLAKEIEEGAVISSALTSDGVPYFYLLKNGEEYRFGGIVDYKHIDYSYYVTVTIFKGKVPLVTFYRTRNSERFATKLEDMNEFNKGVENRSANRFLPASRDFEGKHVARYVRRLPKFKTVPSYLIKVVRRRDSYQVWNTRTNKSIILNFPQK